jgi:hypothetical protein
MWHTETSASLVHSWDVVCICVRAVMGVISAHEMDWLPGGLRLGDNIRAAKQSSPRQSSVQYVRRSTLQRPKQTGRLTTTTRLLILPPRLLIFSKIPLFQHCRPLHFTLCWQTNCASPQSTRTTSTSQWPLARPSRGRTSLCLSLHHSHTPALRTTWTKPLEHPRETTPPSSRPCRHPRAAPARTACHQAPLTSPMSSPMP